MRKKLKNFLKVIGQIGFEVYILTSKTKKIIYISSIGISPYFIEKIDTDVKINKLKKIYLWQLRNYVNDDAVVIDMHKIFAHLFNDGIIIPYRVKSVLDISKALKDAIKLRDNELRKTRKYSYEVSYDSESFKFFYEDMYIPYVKKRYGNFARIDNFGIFEKILKKGELLFIKHKGEYIAGQLSEIYDDTYFLRRNGVLKESFVKEGALVATYYFSILRAKEMNAKTVDFGASKPFLSDGVLRHKNLWGAKICMDESSKRVIYLKNFLFNQPFIYIDNKELKVIANDNDRLINEYKKSGLKFNTV